MKKTRAFTLIEILIALVIFSIMSVLIAYMLYTTFVTRDDLMKKSARLEQLQFASILLTRDLIQLAPKQPFDGSSEKISVTTLGLSNAAGTLARSHLQRVSYVVQQHQLLRVTQSDNHTTTRVLLDDVDHISFRYLADVGDFKSTWLITDRYPVAIAITLSLKNWGDYEMLIPNKAATTP